jgi:hypothetical protein
MQTQLITCDRCRAPHPHIVRLDSKQNVCAPCIDEIGDLLLVAERVANDMTPPIECGFNL